MAYRPNEEYEHLTTGNPAGGKGFNYAETPPLERSALEKALGAICCCMPRTKKARSICFMTTLGIIGLTVALLVLFLPAAPEIKILAMDLDHKEGAFEFLPDPEDPTNPSKMTVRLNIDMNITIKNNNLYGLNFESLTFEALVVVDPVLVKETKSEVYALLTKYIPPAQVNGTDPAAKIDEEITVAKANVTDVLVPSKTEKEVFIDFQLEYKVEEKIGLANDLVVAEMLNVCGVVGKNGTAKATKLKYTIKGVVSGLKAIGYAPAVPGVASIRCPASTAQIAKMTQLVNAGTAVTKALETTFGGAINGTGSTGFVTDPMEGGNGGGAAEGGMAAGGKERRS
ncbi:hypothetical protein DFJ73DRAFT_66394 [Zopfochytrium polystomum]|nr:hypothetical protein DFJ73DRAFT_66394 [Zopfochytrium polystomum]